MAYNFHYTPTGTGVISGKEVLEQTEDAINDLGNTAISGVQEALDKAEQALTNSANAVDDAQTALNTANNAEGVAIQAQTDVSNLSGTVTNIGNRVTTAEGNITNLQGRMTTAESGISGLNTRMGTAEGNITTLQSNVSTAQATANSAQQTANTARQQSYVLRYSSSSVTDNSTIAYSTIDNTDNIKTSDKIIDSDGKIFTIVSVDTTNQTVTVGSALIDLALDGNVVHTSGDETVSGSKTFNTSTGIYNSDSTASTPNLILRSSKSARGTSDTDNQTIFFNDKNNATLASVGVVNYSANGSTYIIQTVNTKDTNEQVITASTSLYILNNGRKVFRPENDNDILLGYSSNRWKSVYATNYYYGNDNVEFSSKFVTSDTSQNIIATKSFTVTPYIYNTDTNASIPNLYMRNQVSEKGNTANPNSQSIVFTDKNNKRLSQIQTNKGSSGETSLNLRVETTDNSNNDINSQINYYITKLGSKNFVANADNEVNLGTVGNKWKDVNTNLINGKNPGALSLPSQSYVDISSYFTNTGTGETNSYTALADGWIFLRLGTISSCQAQILDSSDNLLWGTSASGSVEMLTIPILSGCKLQTQWATGSTVNVATARFYPCQGNV